MRTASLVDAAEAKDAAPAPCAACGSNERQDVVRRGPGARIARCPACGLGTLVDRPTPEQLDALYRSDLYVSVPPRAGALVDLAHRLIGAVRLRLLRRPSAGRLLDVGSGKGHFVAAARRAGWDATGIEVSSAAASEARRRYGIETRVADWATVPLDGPYEVITMWHVLEHLPDPAAAMRRVRLLLADDGRAVISVPNLASLQARLFGGWWFHLDPPRHLYHFTPIALRRLAERTGFEVVAVDTFAPEMEALGVIASVQNRLGVEPNLALRFLKRDSTVRSPLRAVGSLALAALTVPLAGVMAVVAPAIGRGASVQLVARPAIGGPAQSGVEQPAE
ncbi:MAG TPA: class I SAM-dependent methyltransferase [Candidatus Dormibacteraeota bacterium]|nr:class I SAM-dependent methyltransferase [Candidatus Dormibacteraeota bacterium]